MEPFTMFMSKFGVFGLLMVMAWGFPVPTVGMTGEADFTDEYGIGRPAEDHEIQAWNIDVAPTGQGLPPGQGTVEQGGEVYAEKCAVCHGPTGVEGPETILVGGRGSLGSAEPLKTVGSYWPFATTLYDYIYRAMPLTAPQSLSSDEVYSVIAWLLNRNGVIPEEAVIDATSLVEIHMPNRDGFVPEIQLDHPLP